MKIKTGDITIFSRGKKGFNIYVYKGFLGFNFAFKPFKLHVPKEDLMNIVSSAVIELEKWIDK